MRSCLPRFVEQIPDLFDASQGALGRSRPGLLMELNATKHRDPVTSMAF